MQRSLNEIARATGTDKSDRHHGYTGLYEEHLEPRRHEALTLIEIGVADGASLRMWREYLPQARIFGLDRDPSCRIHAGNGIEVFIGDQSDTRLLEEVIRRTGPPDVIIDDGSHIGEQQITAFEALFPALVEGGLYVVEDLHTAYWGWGMRNAVLYFKTLVDAVMLNGRSICADIRNDPRYEQLWSQLGYFERTVESIHFHRSIVLVRKRREAAAPSPPSAGSETRSAPRSAGLPTTAAANVAIVVPVHNAPEHVQRLLPTIAASCPAVPLVVVDDASDEVTHRWLERFLFEAWPGAKEGYRVLLRNERQQLFTRTANRGIRWAYAMRGGAAPMPIEFVAVVNTDCELEEGWLKALLWGMEDAGVGLVGFAEPADGLEPAYREMREPDYIEGHCILLRMAMLAQIGVFCETDTQGSADSPGLERYLGQAHVGSDRALSWRANRAGWKTLYCHYLLCQHLGAGSWHRDLQWLSGFPLAPLWSPCDELENPGWAEQK